MMWKSRLTKTASLLVLAGGLLISAPQPARAMIVEAPDVDALVASVEASDVGQFVLEIAQWYQQNVQASMAAVASQVAQWMRANLEIQMTDTRSANGRQETNAHLSGEIAGRMAQQKGYSACAVAQSGIGRSEVSTGRSAVTGAMTQAGANRDQTSYSTDIRAEMADGLVPCSTAKDNDTSSYKALNCTQQWGGKFEKADQSMDVLFGSYAADTKEGTPYELLVPPGFTLTNGVYQPIPIVTNVQYMPFVAAYSFCQRINPRRGRLAAMVSGKATSDVLAAGAKNDADAAVSSAFSMCMNLLAERMQYGSGLSGSLAQLNISQKAVCAADFNRKWFGNNSNGGPSVLSTNAKCQADGRSELQAKYDIANRDSYAEYHSGYLNGLERETVAILEANAQKEKSDFDAYVLNERTALEKAIADSHNMSSVNVNPAMAMPVAGGAGP